MAQPRKELTLTRVLNAPVEKVWEAWTDAEQIAQWWGPKGVTNPTCEWDARPGGKLHIVMLAGPELGPMAGQEWPMQGIFEEVVPHERLVFSNIAIDAAGNHLLEGTTTVTFAEENGKTTLTVHNSVVGISPQAPQMLAGMEQGWNEQLDKLVAYVR